MRNAAAEVVSIAGDVGNSAEAVIAWEQPYTATVAVRGVSAILFHRWQSDSIEAKAAAKKGSAAKKTDDIESYVYRNDEGVICLPGEYLRGSMIDPKNGAAKYKQDPRSPRKSALDLFKAGVIALTNLAPITRADGTLAAAWDFVDRRRVMVQRNGITRSRPGLVEGWTAEVQLLVQTPSLISPSLLADVLTDAGRLVGVGDFRPTFGRFHVVGFKTE